MGMALITIPTVTGRTISARRFTTITATGTMAMVGIIIRAAGGITTEGTER